MEKLTAKQTASDLTEAEAIKQDAHTACAYAWSRIRLRRKI